MGEPTLHLRHQAIHLGDVLEAKGTVSVFRDTRQIELKRLFGVNNTNAEAAAWAKTAQWMRDVLGRPWVLTAKEREVLDKKIAQEEKVERARTRGKREWEAKHGEKKKRHEEKAEAKRKRAEVRYNEGALKGSAIIRAPWE